VQIIAVGSPKGGVGKTTTAVTMATIAARSGLVVLLVDADSNRSALDWCSRAGDAIPVDITSGRDFGSLSRLRELTAYDLVVIDLPGAHEGAFEAVVTGDGGRPVADLLVAPTAPELMDMRPFIRVIESEVIPLGLPHLVVLTRVATEAARRANERREQLRARGLTVAETIIRRFVVYDEAIERSRTVLDVGGSHSYARIAEGEYRHLTAEALTALGTTLEAHRGA
jgi:chromosome partitioning protein